MTAKEEIIENTPHVKKTRQAGLEILRILSIFLITCVHMLNYGGFLGNAGSVKELALLRLLYSFFTVSVNVFVLISGYFLVKSKFKISKVIKLWLTVVFYTVSLYVISMIFFHDAFSFKDLIKCFFPLIFQKYWFFTAYFCLYLISPLLNKILNNIDKKQAIIILAGIFVLSYFSKRFDIDTVINLNSGYNVLWFICLYFIGGIIKLFPFKDKKWLTGLMFIGSILLIWLNFYYNKGHFGYKILYNSPEYTAPLVLLGSISLFLLFKDFSFKNSVFNKIVSIISSTTFGIYLLQEGNFIKPHIYFDILKVQNRYGNLNSILYIFAFVLIIFAAGFIFDLVRQFIFKTSYKIYDKLKCKIQRTNEWGHSLTFLLDWLSY